jgi:hypothetical protein
MAMEMVLRRMNIEDATVHGFRSWAGNVSNFQRESQRPQGRSSWAGHVVSYGE